MSSRVTRASSRAASVLPGQQKIRRMPQERSTSSRPRLTLGPPSPERGRWARITASVIGLLVVDSPVGGCSGPGCPHAQRL
jgi:hypothetical protein